ncbi:MAG: hypothetical protein RSC68_00470 [Acinetobacter sp.]
MKPAIKHIYAVSQQTAQAFCQSAYANISTIISITDSTADLLDTSGLNEKNIIRLQFKDYDTGKSAMSKAQAIQLAERLPQVCDILIVHCTYGESRSQGVAAAIDKYCNGNDERYFKNHSPSLHCYRLVLSALVQIYGKI